MQQSRDQFALIKIHGKQVVFAKESISPQNGWSNDIVTKHLNVYNNLVSQITYVGITVAEEDKWITI